MSTRQNIVIVAEDEPLVRMLAAETLAEAGFTVVEAAHAGEAIAAVEKHDGQVLALFTDVHMPGGCSGLELVQLVYRQWPCIALLVTSGQHRFVDGDIPPGGLFVLKPYEPDQIVSHIRSLALECSGIATAAEAHGPDHAW